MQLNDLIRLGPWFGRIVGILTDDATGEKFARAKLIKHWTVVAEICPIVDLSPATEAQVQQAMNAVQERQKVEWLEILDN